MSRSSVWAYCIPCLKRECERCKEDDHMFPIFIEWKNRDELIEYLKEVKCPCCGSRDWQMTDKYVH